MTCMFFSRCYTAHDGRLAHFFGRYGRIIAHYPWCIIILSLAVNLLFGIGIIRFEYETDLEVQYYLENSRAYKDREFLRNNFHNSNDNFHVYSLDDAGYFGEIIIKSTNGRNIFDENIFKEVIYLDNVIKNKIFLKNEMNVTSNFNDLCARSQRKCVVFGDVIFYPLFMTKMRSQRISFPLYNNVLLSSIIGNATVKDGYLISGEMVRLRYFLSEETDDIASQSKLWIKKFVSFMKNITTNETTFVTSYYNAMDEEVTKSAMAEAHLFPLTFVLMIVYASIATAGKRVDCVYGMQNLGRVGVFCAVISMIPAVGIASALGIKFMNSVAVMPFLIIGIGINDMFIIMSGHAETVAADISIEERMKRTLMTSGLAITVTSITDILTFFIGYTSIFNTIKNFCVYTGLAVFFCYVNQLTILAPCIVIQQRRTDAAKHSYTCRVTQPKEHLLKEGRSSCYIICCSGQKPITRTEMESILETYPKRLVQFLVKNKISKSIIIAIYAAYLGLSLWGVQSLKQSTKFSELALEGSDFHTTCVWDYDNFPLEIPIQIVFTSPLDYENKDVQASIDRLLQSLKNDSLVRDDLEISWLSLFRQINGNKMMKKDDFFFHLKLFINFTKIFKDDIIFSKDENSIVASRMFLFSNNLRTTEQQARFIVNVRKIADDSGLPCSVYSPLFAYFEQYVTMIKSTLQTVGVAITAMFIVTCFFMPHPIIIFLVSVSMLSILIGVFGFLKFWGLDISAVTMIELIISVGFSVDFSAHICHAYLSSPSRAKESRVMEALELAGGPIINGSLSTIVGLSMLILSRSFIFQSFFKVLFMVVCFGLFHAVLILPIILTIMGPRVEILTNQKRNNSVKTEMCNGNVDLSMKPLFPVQNGAIHKPLLNGTCDCATQNFLSNDICDGATHNSLLNGTCSSNGKL